MRKGFTKLKFKRQRKGKTNYNRRLKLVQSRKPRLIVRVTSGKIIAQIANFSAKGDRVLFCETSKNLEKLGWKYNLSNIPSAYLTGFLLGKKASKDIKEAVLDLGLKKVVAGSRTLACLKGALDAGIKIPHSEDIIPNEARLKGEHIKKYAESLKGKDEYNKVFSAYIKAGSDPSKITEDFDKVKSKIGESA